MAIPMTKMETSNPPRKYYERIVLSVLLLSFCVGIVIVVLFSNVVILEQIRCIEKTLSGHGTLEYLVTKPTEKGVDIKPNVVIGSVLCRNESDSKPREQAAEMISSILTCKDIYKKFSKVTIHFFIEFEEDRNYLLEKIKEFSHKKFNANLIEILFHSVMDYKSAGDLPNHSKLQCSKIPCLFPKILKDMDSVLYLNSSSQLPEKLPTGLWSDLDKLSEGQTISSLKSHQFTQDILNFQNASKHFPEVKLPLNPLSSKDRLLNSNMLLINLTKIRENGWDEKFVPLCS